MFTGIVQSKGLLKDSLPREGGAMRWVIEAAGMDWEMGESIAVNGCCLTVAELVGKQAAFDLSPETLRLTTCGQRMSGDSLNLEKALKAGDKMGGHFVSGHVDGIATLVGRRDQGAGCEMDFDLPKDLIRFVANKGSVALDGISLTPFKVEGQKLTVALIPHTLKETNLGSLKTGDKLNLEIDLLARYVQRLMETKV